MVRYEIKIKIVSSTWRAKWIHKYKEKKAVGKRRTRRTRARNPIGKDVTRNRRRRSGRKVRRHIGPVDRYTYAHQWIAIPGSCEKTSWEHRSKLRVFLHKSIASFLFSFSYAPKRKLFVNILLIFRADRSITLMAVRYYRIPSKNKYYKIKNQYLRIEMR